MGAESLEWHEDFVVLVEVFLWDVFLPEFEPGFMGFNQLNKPLKINLPAKKLLLV